MTNVLRASRGLYKMLLLAYPQDFRYRFESEMLTTFSDLICGEWEQNGLPGVARVWRSALGELLSVAAPLHLQSPIVVAMALSFLCSSALFTTIYCAMTHVCSK